MDLDAHQQLMDACCLWLYVRQQLKNELSAEYMLKMDDMWTNGPLGWELGVCVCVGGRWRPPRFFGMQYAKNGFTRSLIILLHIFDVQNIWLTKGWF